MKGIEDCHIGYGSQGHAHANNLKESGVDVIVGELPGVTTPKRPKQQVLRFPMPAMPRPSPVIVILLPDELRAASIAMRSSELKRALS